MQSFKGHFYYVNSVAFSPDGKYVLTGSSDTTARLWDLKGKEIHVFKGHTKEIMSVAFSPACPDDPIGGKYILTGSFDNTAKLWDLNGHEIQSFIGHTNYVSSVAFSPDGKYILTSSMDNTAKLWDLKGTEIKTFKVNGIYFGTVAFSPDGKYILAGFSDTEEKVKLWDLKGREVQSFVGHVNFINSVAFSSNGKYVLTGSDDNTTKIWNKDTGKELATLLSVDSIDWVVTTPSGLFDASPGAMKLMYYVQGLEVIELEQLKERYYEPGLLAKITGFDKSELRNVAAFDKVALYPEIKAVITKDQLHIALTERTGGLGKLSLFINNKEVKEDINPQRLKALNIDLITFAKYYRADTDNTIGLRAYNKEGWLKSQAYELPYRLTTLPGNKTIPHLYAIVVGTANYAGDRLDLRFPDLDADAMAKAFQSTGSALFGIDHTSVRMLCTAGSGDVSSKTNIQKAFTDLAAKATPDDILVVYFSGHGLAYGDAEKAQFYYLTKDIGNEDLSDPVVRNSYTISSDEFTKWLTAIPA
ncbi:MAG: caspase family protein, partial [Saprospiraceae bacterium]